MHPLKPIFNELKKGNTGLFFGAGMSFNSGIPTVPTIIKEILTALHVESYYIDIKSLNYPFELFMEQVSLFVDIDKFLDIFSEGEPNHFHYLVKDMVENGLVKNIMTTNFDLLIEKTTIRNLSGIVDNERNFNSVKHGEVNLIKIHGSVSDKRTIRTTMSQIFKKQFRKGRSGALSYFFKEADLSYILVMGYSCSDKIDLSPIIASIKDSNTEILFIEHSGLKTVSFKDIKDHPIFKDYKGKWIVCNTDEFLRKLNREIFHSRLIQKSAAFATGRYFNFGSIAEGIPELIVSNIFFKNSKYQMAKDILENVLATKILTPTVKAEISAQLIETSYNHYLYLKDDLNKIHPSTIDNAINLYTSLNDLHGLGQVYNHAGHIKIGLKKYAEALNSYNKAEDFFRQIPNKFRMAQILNNKGHVYLTEYEDTFDPLLLENAKYYFKKCYTYFKSSGYIFEYAVILYNLGCIWAKNPKRKKTALKYLEKGKQFSQDIGDIDGVELCDKEIEELNK